MAISTLTNRNDSEDEPVIKAEQFLAYKRLLRKVPNSFIIVPSNIVLQLIKHYKIKKAGHVISGDIFIISANGVEVGLVCSRSYGAPAIAMVVEELVALGAKHLVLVGSAGSLQHDLNPGSVVLSAKAIREDGTSYHYTKPSKYATPSRSLNKAIKISLEKNGVSYSEGATWTTDGFYREMKRKVKRYTKEGVLCVDMETSALFTVAEYHKTDATALLYITDSLATLEWQPYFGSEAIEKGRLLLLKAAIDALCMSQSISFTIKPTKQNIRGLVLTAVLGIVRRIKCLQKL